MTIQIASKVAHGAVADDVTPTQQALPKPVDRRRKALLRFAISITAFNVLGHLLLGFEQAPIVPIATVAVSYVMHLLLEMFDAWAHQRAPEYAGGRIELFYFLLPAHITALACSMLIYTSTLWPFLFAVTVAAASKYVFRVRVKGRLRHYLNPSNTGIAVALLLIPLVGFAPPYMFLNNTGTALDVLIPLGVLMAGTMLNGKLTGKMPLIAAWVGGFVLQGLVRSIWADDVFISVLGAMTGVAFVLFTNYMITDPGTTPISTRGQVVFGLTVAGVYGLLIAAQVAYAIFFALVITCAIRGMVMYLAPRLRRWRSSAQHRRTDFG
ncbi:enediyne biosynthesis protein [Nocardia sp. CNY236]|uniref:enediyne biosynthesis protein n=1 Tax=Nocardia sp. CNY236 TaxID=1169152 RepID=UPI0003F74E95|nr:enediyne biosynthesis protein [Nocardia sp. CNY236]